MPWTGLIDGCKPLCKYQKSEPGPLEGQPVLLIIGPSLQQLFWFVETEFDSVTEVGLNLLSSPDWPETDNNPPPLPP